MDETGQGKAERDDREQMNIAIAAAKDYLLRAFRDENLEKLGLEEVKHSGGNIWQITLGFMRRWHEPPARNSFLQMAAIATAARSQREYEVVTVDLDGPKGLSIVNHGSE
jgi:hypothetical protein